MKKLSKVAVAQILENLEDTCFPLQIDWNNRELYIKGLMQAMEGIAVQDEKFNDGSDL